MMLAKVNCRLTFERLKLAICDFVPARGSGTLGAEAARHDQLAEGDFVTKG
jgi:hypothetical protein